MLTISLDGPKSIHDKNRVFKDGRGSFDVIMENIAHINELVPDYARKVSFSMVLDPRNDFDCINEIIVASKDFNNHNFLANIVDKGYDEDKVTYEEEYLWKVQYQHFLALLAFFGRYPEEKVSAIIRNSIGTLLKDFQMIQSPEPLHTIDVPSGPCIPGQLRLFVDINGNFSLASVLAKVRWSLKSDHLTWGLIIIMQRLY